MISVQEFDRWNTWGKNAWRFSSLSTFFNLFCFRTLKIHRETWQTRGKKKSTEVWEKVLVRRRRELALKVPVESEERGLEGKRERGTKEAWAEKSLAEGGCNYYESRKWVWFTRGERGRERRRETRSEGHRDKVLMERKDCAASSSITLSYYLSLFTSISFNLLELKEMMWSALLLSSVFCSSHDDDDDAQGNLLQTHSLCHSLKI